MSDEKKHGDFGEPGHTPEPWLTDAQPGEGYSHDWIEVEPETFMPVLPPRDYKRAIACVNACAGMADPREAVFIARAVAASIAGSGCGDFVTVTVDRHYWERFCAAFGSKP